MKNVAGFDVSRLMAGAMGTLGVLLEVSLRVVPVVETEVTLEYGHSNVSESINWLGNLLRQPLPVTAACWYQGKTRIRISGSKLGVDHAVQQLNGDISNDSEFWSEINHHKHPFFDSPELLRISTDCSDSSESRCHCTTKIMVLTQANFDKYEGFAIPHDQIDFTEF